MKSCDGEIRVKYTRGGEFMYTIRFYDGIWYSKIVFISFREFSPLNGSFLSVI